MLDHMPEGSELTIAPMIMITPDRVLHICRLGSQLDHRVMGALVIYIGLEDDIVVHLRGEDPIKARVVVVPPFKAHRIVAGHQFVKTVLVEPETVSDESLIKLESSLNGLSLVEAETLGLLTLPKHPDQFSRSAISSYSSQIFDIEMFSYGLEPRPMDDRIKAATDLVKTSISDVILTSDCTVDLEISSSRFRRLFVSNTGIQFRHYKMWKRARSYLEKILAPASLTQIAMDLGYPDSTHFSRSIRSTYGLPPRRMKAHMQDSAFFLTRNV
ncbi:hypothetical protein DL239_15100 [Sedimentitalea sp. CY04]|uniref:HTH araC/xylS-type domain-containing protein n=1 Tax=Parasedimentitalea denitrificans TaxID=2211118 RepID=A0ABX0WA43_9RHOB|nr:helix-turn-helix domain-containing protein [Sedimentitalea sp. CY04]NIZ62301.1 hypothetical protein [Sedimentitalea sp. CY04]